MDEIYIARDFSGIHYFENEPVLMKCGPFSIWTGHRISWLNRINLQFKGDINKIPVKKCFKLKLENIGFSLCE